LNSFGKAEAILVAAGGVSAALLLVRVILGTLGYSPEKYSSSITAIFIEIATTS